MKFILGTKLHMTQKFREDGSVVPMTAISAGPVTVTQVKGDKDGYSAVQVGYGHKKTLSKSVTGHLKNLANFRWLKEFRLTEAVERGQQIDVSTFNVGDIIEVTGWSKGKGFQGVVKRHGFHGSPKTHGHKDQVRMPGSIGAGEPQHVFKGKRMAGRMGNDQVTLKKLEVMEVDTEKNIIYVKGAIPGARNGLIMISGEGELKLRQPQVETKPEETVAEVTPEVVSEEVTEVVAAEPVASEAPVETAVIEAETTTPVELATSEEDVNQAELDKS